MGDLRWAKPAPAPKNSTLQDGSYGNACPQAAPKGLNVVGSGSDSPLGTAIDDFLTDLLTPLADYGSEDCLFLDVYVPGSAVRSSSTSKLPVVHWIYGGGFILGDKNQLQPALPFYDGSGLVSQSGNNIIFVGSNYRLGAFGWLAGTSMEQAGLPNAGLYDQQAAMQWTRDNIALFGGDPDNVTAMGESAGASSLMHHLVFNGGATAPLFNRAILQSPAFLPQFDRKGRLEEIFQNFSSLAGCPSTGTGTSSNSTSSSSASSIMSCLRAADTSTLLSANTKLNAEATPGTFLVGPAPDGSLIRQLPALEIASGNYYKSLSSLLVTHTSSESTIFVDGSISTDAQFSTFLTALFPPYASSTGLDAAIESQYPAVASGSGSGGAEYADEGDRVRAMVRDSSFTCNARFLAQAYAGSTYAGSYGVTPGWHATDLLPTFWSDALAASALGTALELALPLFSGFAAAYKSYLTSFVRAGDPNTYRDGISLPLTVDWPLATGAALQGGAAQEVGNVLGIGDLGFGVQTAGDDQDGAQACEFWLQWTSAVTAAGGYTPPGVQVVGSAFWNGTADSQNYGT